MFRVQCYFLREKTNSEKSMIKNLCNLCNVNVFLLINHTQCSRFILLTLPIFQFDWRGWMLNLFIALFILISSRFLLPLRVYHQQTRYSNMWQRRTTLEKVLISFYLILGVLVLTSLVTYFAVFNRNAGKRPITQTTSI